MSGGADDRARPGEVAVDEALTARLLAAQFPQWADSPLAPLRHGGTDNAIFRLGADMVLRLPRHGAAAAQLDKEALWLSRIAPHLPLAVPVPLAGGQPGEGYPFSWSVCRWLDGEHPDPDRLTDAEGVAKSLADFIRALRAVDAADGPTCGAHNFWRGAPLALRDSAVHAALAEAGDMIDAGAAAKAWEADLRAPAWPGPPLWIHGDLHPGNLLLNRNRLCAVIDFGGLAVGDPACDLLAAWYLFPRDWRDVFRAALDVDDASWARGRGWALSMALIALPYYKKIAPSIAAISLRVIDAVLADHKANGPPASG